MANLTDLSQALRTLASRSPDDVSVGLTEAASQLDLAVNLANRHGDRDLQDMLQAALGHAELGIGIQLRHLLQEVSGIRDVGKDTHGLVMGVQHEVHALQAALEDLEQGQERLEAGQRLLATQVNTLGEQQSEHAAILASFRASRDQSISERRQHREEIDQLRRAYTELSAQIARALALSARARTKAADEADDAGVE